MGVELLHTTVAGQGCVIARGAHRTASRLVVYLHGAGGAYNFPMDLSLGSAEMRELGSYLAERDYVVAFPVLTAAAGGANTWGNNGSTDQLALVIAALQALPFVSAGKYGLIAASMGTFTALNHARRVSYANIAGIWAMIPTINLDEQRGTDAAQGVFYASINTAYAVANDAAWNALHNTYQPVGGVSTPVATAFGAALACPVRLSTNASDPTAVPAQSQVLADANPTYVEHVSAGAGVHTFLNVRGKDVGDWFAARSW